MNFKNLLLLVMVFTLFGCTKNQDFDIIILNGKIYDGAGGDPFVSDIGIIGSTIEKIGDLTDAKGAVIIEADGLAVSPGFIDMHAHLDPILELSECESAIRQGVTTALGGPDGSGPWPLQQYLDTLEEVGVGMNVAYLIGHNTVRRNVMKLENRAPTNDELGR